MQQLDTPSPARAIKVVSGAEGELGHLRHFSERPIEFLQQVFAECGEVGQFNLAGLDTVLLVGPDAHEAFFRAPDKQLNSAAAYQMMVPIFGEGVQYGAPPAIERQQLRMQYQGLKHDRMVNYADVVAKEAQAFIADWGDEGEIDIYQAFTDLLLRTSTHCLFGAEFRQKLTNEFAELYHDLEDSLSPASLSDPEANKTTATKRDVARKKLEQLITERVQARRADGGWEHDMLQIYMDATYDDGRSLTDHEITGMVIWFMFAGHHTSSNTSAWTLLEIARHPQYRDELQCQIDALFVDSQELSLDTIKNIPLLEGFIRECLRIHPPLNAISRRVLYDWEYNGYTVEAGKNVMISPYVSHKLPEFFPDPETFNPKREAPENLFAEIPFGGGRHKCVGNAFAILQVKAIFAILLRDYDFELTQPAESYREFMPALILRPSDPCVLRYKKRATA